MGDENLTTNEETESLFVSNQKKRQAEEEARRKAEEERARREAEADEIRRKEQEVEERRRKAEEEKKALEEAEKESANRKAAQSEEAKAEPKPKQASKPKTPILIGIAAAAVVVVVLLVLVLGRKSPEINYDTLACDTEYKVQAQGLDVTLYYPGEVYSGASEAMSESGGAVKVTFTPSNSNAPDLTAIITSCDITAEEIAMTPQSIDAGLKEISQSFVDPLQITDDGSTDFAKGGSQPFKYSGAYKDDTSSSTLLSWIGHNTAGERMFIISTFTKKGEELKDQKYMRSAFEAKNLEDAVMIPGAYPPIQASWDGSLNADLLNMKVKAPYGWHEMGEKNGAYGFYDENGAIVMIAGEEIGAAGEVVITDATEGLILQEIDYVSKEGFDGGLNISGRMFQSDSKKPFGHIDYMCDFKLAINDIPYHEKDYFVMWRSDNETVYLAMIFTYYPEANSDVYGTIFEKSFEELDEIRKGED